MLYLTNEESGFHGIDVIDALDRRLKKFVEVEVTLDLHVAPEDRVS